MSAAGEQLFIRHVQELRARLLWSVTVLITAASVAYLFRLPIIGFIAKPLNQQLIYTAPSGGFQFVLQVCLSVGMIVALPIFIYNVWRFIEPAFTISHSKRRRNFMIISVSLLLAALGVVFAYMAVLPMSLHFFASFSVGPIKPLISTSEYLSFVVGCLITFAVIFQLPLLLLLYNNINRFPPGSLRKYRRHVIIGSLALALVLPFTYDPLTQFVIALPIIFLYEVSILGVWAVNRLRPRPEQVAVASEAPISTALIIPESAPAPLMPRPVQVRPIPARPRRHVWLG